MPLHSKKIVPGSCVAPGRLPLLMYTIVGAESLHSTVEQ